MGWMHDYRDVSRNRRRASGAARVFTGGGAPDQYPGEADPLIGIPHILRRRARWVGARLRHSRSA